MVSGTFSIALANVYRICNREFGIHYIFSVAQFVFTELVPLHNFTDSTGWFTAVYVTTHPFPRD